MITPIISAGARTYLRSIASRNFVETVSIQRHVTQDSPSGMSESWVTVSTTKCWIRQMKNPDLHQNMGGIYVLSVFRFLMPWDTDVNPGDQMVIGDEKYLVQNTNHEDSNRISLIVLTQKLEGS